MGFHYSEPTFIAHLDGYLSLIFSKLYKDSQILMNKFSPVMLYTALLFHSCINHFKIFASDALLSAVFLSLVSM